MKLFRFSLIGILLAASASAEAQTYVEARWETPPDSELTSSLVPAFAAWMGISSTVTLQCRADRDGHPFNCRVISETSPGLGFGAAARLVAASGMIRAARIDERVVGGSFRTRVNFIVEDFESPSKKWGGSQPTPAALAVAAQITSRMDDPTKDEWDRLEGLDHDRRVVVSGWIDELLPLTDTQARQVRTIQLARLFSEDDLRRILKGERVEMPSEEAFLKACPEPTPQELAAMKELRRRYCNRYEC